MRFAGTRRAVLVALLGFSLLGAACADTSGCSDFHPDSEELDVGRSALVEVEIVRGGWATPDISGDYWSTRQPVPEGAPHNGTIRGRARMVSASRVDIDFGDLGVVTFTGPIGCE